jgi:nucleoside-diphosphate-sugar epimerase
MEGNRILVTGATGFVGRRLVADLLARGHVVTRATRLPSADPAFEGRSVVVGEIGPETDWAGALAGVRAVVHLAGHVHVAPERAEADAALFDRVNHLGATRLFDAAAGQDVRLFVFISTIAVLGAESGALPFTEATPPAPDTPYARSKLAAERALAERSPGGGPSLVILRPPLVCGPGVKGNLASLIRLAASGLPLPLGGVRNRRTMLSIDNLVAAIGAVLDGPESAPGSALYNLGDATPLSISEIVRAIGDGLGRRPRLFALPPGLVRRAAEALGRKGLHQRVFGSLEVDSSAFRRAYGWSDRVDTRTSLAEAARHQTAKAGRGR